MKRAAFFGCAVTAVVLSGGRCAFAHSMYQSAVMLDLVGREMHAEIQLPLERMEMAFGKEVVQQALSGRSEDVSKYIVNGFSAVILCELESVVAEYSGKRINA